MDQSNFADFMLARMDALESENARLNHQLGALLAQGDRDEKYRGAQQGLIELLDADSDNHAAQLAVLKTAMGIVFSQLAKTGSDPAQKMSNISAGFQGIVEGVAESQDFRMFQSMSGGAAEIVSTAEAWMDFNP